ncbi:MAG TPA: TfoX/Sxy family protein [Candidatus Cloacimonadota bacterium]|nr:TfoX/Sxy family protein [Candidatus Cloacimonadota bacterium]
MASRADIVEHIAAQIASAGVVRYLKMFGEYGIYCDEKMIALVADDQLFVKPTQAGREYIGEVEEAPPCPGAKLWFLIPEDNWDDSAWLTELIRITTAEVPSPKPKKPKKDKTAGK